MPNFLLIDTSSKYCSAAIAKKCNIFSHLDKSVNKHSEIIFELLNKLLKNSGLELNNFNAIAFSAGPGSFTGLRVAASITQSISFSLNLPVIKIYSLDLIAYQALEFINKTQKNFIKNIVIIQDARMGEFYFAHYQVDLLANNLVLLADFKLVNDNYIYNYLKNMNADNLLLTGDSCSKFNSDNSGIAELAIIAPDAKYGVNLVNKLYKEQRFTDLNNVVPLYLRNNIAYG